MLDGVGEWLDARKATGLDVPGAREIRAKFPWRTDAFIKEACELSEEQVASMRQEVESAIATYDFENGGPTYITVGDTLWGKAAACAHYCANNGEFVSSGERGRKKAGADLHWAQVNLLRLAKIELHEQRRWAEDQGPKLRAAASSRCMVGVAVRDHLGDDATTSITAPRVGEGDEDHHTMTIEHFDRDGLKQNVPGVPCALLGACLVGRISECRACCLQGLAEEVGAICEEHGLHDVYPA